MTHRWSNVASLLLAVGLCGTELELFSHQILAEEPATNKAEAPPVLNVSSPQENAKVKGLVTFAVRLSGWPDLASIEYRLNGRPFSGPMTVKPYRSTWHSAEMWDGPATIQAVARDASGKVLMESKVIRFTVANGQGSIRMVTPDPAKIMRGAIKWSVEANRPLSGQEIAKLPRGRDDRLAKPIEAILFFVDGKLLRPPVYGTRKAAVDLNTTRWANGRHELFVAAYSSEPGLPPVAMLRVPATFDNGRALRELRPRFRDLFLTPGEAADLAPFFVYTDGTQQPLKDGIRFTSDAPAVAAVDRTGLVKGIAPGVATVSLTARGREATARVIVDKAHGLPHFARDGYVLTRYDPARSLWVRSLFGLGPDEVGHTPRLAGAAHAAAINTLTAGFYLNPADGGRPPDLTAWRKGWEPWWENIERSAKHHGFSLLLTGDDIARTNGELANSVTNRWSADALQLAFTKARDSQRVVCVEMVDEISFLWGNTPTPTDGRWKKRSPPLADDAFLQLMKTINGVKDRPPVSWPIGGMSGPVAARNWMGNPAVADYASLFWTHWDWRRAYPESASLPQDREGMDRSVIGNFPVLQRNRPMMLLVSLSGVHYTKRGDGSEYTPGQDRQDSPGTSSVSCAAQVMYAAARGMAGVRAYHFDAPRWKDERRKAKSGQEGLQTGSDPFEVGTDRWQSLASAFRLVRLLEPHLLQPPMHALNLGPAIVTGARQGPVSRLLSAVNFSEAPEKAHVDLRPYRYAEGPAIVRHRLVGATLQSDTVPNGESDRVTFAPGEAVVWLCRPAAAIPPTVTLSAPLPGATVSGKVAVTAQVGDGGKVDRVEFFVDGRAIATAKAAPYTVTWDSGTAKARIWHSVSAVAYDAAGSSAEARIAVFVRSPEEAK